MLGGDLFVYGAGKREEKERGCFGMVVVEKQQITPE